MGFQEQFFSIIFFCDWFMTPRRGKHQSLSDGQNSDLSEPVRCLVTDFADFVWRAFSLHRFTASRAVVNLSENAAGENSKDSQFACGRVELKTSDFEPNLVLIEEWYWVMNWCFDLIIQSYRIVTCFFSFLQDFPRQQMAFSSRNISTPKLWFAKLHSMSFCKETLTFQTSVTIDDAHEVEDLWCTDSPWPFFYMYVNIYIYIP